MLALVPEAPQPPRRSSPARAVLGLLILALCAWLGYQAGVRKAPPGGSGGGPAPILRLHGSNTIGKTLAPNLAEKFLEKLGAVRVHQVPGREDELTVEGTLNGSPVVIEVQAHGTGTAFEDLASGKADIGLASRRIKPEEQAKFSGIMTSATSEHVLGLDGVAVLVSPVNPIESLSVTQIRDIFCGRITDWSQVGGAAAAIRVYSRNDKSGTFDIFKAMVLKDCPLAPYARHDYEDSEKLSDDVAADAAGIGFVGMPYIRGCKALKVSDAGALALRPTVFTVATEDYRLSRRLYLYLPPLAPSSWATRFVAFALSDAGQQIVDATGFVGQSLLKAATRTLEDVQAAGGEVPSEYAVLTRDAEQQRLNFRFEKGSNALDNKARRDVGRLVERLALPGNHRRALLLIGFTDNVGGDAANLRLSRERARAVARELLQEGLQAAAVTGFGKARPVAGNDTEEGRARNRRVEVWLRR